MIERYYEDQITRDGKNLSKGKVIACKSVKIVVYILAGIFLCFIIPFWPIPKDASALDWVMTVVFGWLVPLGFLFGVWLFANRFLAKCTEEFDYVLNGSDFRIVRVTNFKKRKLFLEFKLTEIESIGKVSGNSYEKLHTDRELKKVYAIVNYNDEQVNYMLLNTDGGRKLLHAELSDEMQREIRMSLGRDIAVKD